MLASFIIIFAIVALIRYNFDQGFSNYLQTKRIETLQPLSDELALRYFENNNDWSFLRNKPRVWKQILSSLPQFKSNANVQDQLALQANKAKSSNEQKINKPTTIAERIQLRRQERRQHLERHNLQKFNRSIERNLLVLDAKKRPVFGSRAALDSLRLIEISSDNQINNQSDNQIIGYLGLPPFNPEYQYNELSFFDKQKKSIILIALFGLGVAVLFAWLLASQFLRPITKIAKHTRQLASKNYQHRIDEFSKDELGSLSKDLNSLALTLEQSQTSRQRWIADISHELRTPLSVLQGEIESMLDGIREVNQPAIVSLKNETQQLNRLVNDLYELSLSDVGALDYNKQNTDMIELLSLCLDSFKPLFERANIKARLNINFDQTQKTTTLLLDSARIQQLFSNLFNNSLKYTQTPGHLNITVEHSGKELTISLQDSAPSIPQSEIPQLFERFYRVEQSRNRKTGGAGLGLAICKNIVQAHDGQISASQSEIGGLTIKISFPVL